MFMRGEKFENRNPQEEANEKYFRALREMEEQSCRNKRDSRMSCMDNCSYYGSEKCLHPEKVF